MAKCEKCGALKHRDLCPVCDPYWPEEATIDWNLVGSPITACPKTLKPCKCAPYHLKCERHA